jgi:glycogen synthase
MNICFISKEYPPETGGGGIGTHLHALALALVNRGHSVVVLSSTLGDHPGYSLCDGIHVYRIPVQIRYGFFNRLVYAMAVRKKVLSLIQAHHIQIIEAPEYDAESVFLELLGCPVPVVVRLQAGTRIVYKMAEKIPKDPVAILAIIFEWLAINKADAITAPTQYMAAFTKHLLKLPDRKITILPNTAELPEISKPRKDYSKPDKRILFVGRLEKRKSPDVLARAIPDILRVFPNTVFTFIGMDLMQGPGKSSMQSYCKKLIGKEYLGKVEFLGKIAHEEVEKYYLISDIFVLPSRFESFGVVYAEAMLHQLPIVACKGAGVEEIIPDHTGLLVKHGDAGDLCDAILRLLGNEQLRQRMGTAGKEFAASHFCAPVVAEAHEYFYHSLLEKSSGR